jgi:UDP-glucose 4-epimerase
MTHALVTGGAGFIGSHIVDGYLARGWRVTVIDDLSTGRRENVDPRAELIERDLRDPATAELLTVLRPDVVNHHAAQADVRVSVADPAADADANVVASVRLLQKSLEAGVERFIFASSGGATYGEPVYAPQDERHPQIPLSPYGCAKLSVEHYLTYFRQVHGLDAVALRYANVYGPRQNPHGEAGVVAIFAGRLLAGGDVTINGNGEQTRDFVYVGDVVRANMAVSEQELPGAWNVGTGVETSVNELAQLMADACGVSLVKKRNEAKAGEQLRSVLEGGALRDAASLPPPVTFREGLAATVEWLRSRST